jgi:hypothetical protein
VNAASIPLSALPAVADKWRRDQWGRYLVAPKPGDKPVGYTRATTVAKALDSGGGLAAWNATMAACGMTLRPGLRARWEALMAEHDGNPWYAGEHSKAECKQLVKECAAVGGANDRSEMGTSLHTITALVDTGRTPHLSEETERDVRAYLDGLAAAGITPVPDAVELTVVLHDWRVAGTFDRLKIVPGFELPLIADLKTGADLSYSWQTMAVQLAIYSRGDEIYRQGRAEDGSEDVRLPMPAVDQTHGLIMWLDAGSGKLELFLVDLVAGWEAFEHSMFARAWRKRDVSISLADYRARTELMPALEASLAELAQRGLAASGDPQAQIVAVEKDGRRYEPAPGGGMVDVGPAGVPASPESGEVIDADQTEPDANGPAQPEHTNELRTWLQSRIDAIGKHAEARNELAGMWPRDVPSLLVSADHTPEQLAAIELACNAVEKRFRLPFPPPKPDPDTDAAVARVLHMFPNSTPITQEQPS